MALELARATVLALLGIERTNLNDLRRWYLSAGSRKGSDGHRAETREFMRAAFAASSVVAGIAVPPDAGTRWSGPLSLGEKTITPSGLQLPPCPMGAFASVSGGPPAASIVLSLPPAKNPMDLLSGDQNGNLAFSVPASGCAVREFKGRTHSRVFLHKLALDPGR